MNIYTTHLLCSQQAQTQKVGVPGAWWKYVCASNKFQSNGNFGQQADPVEFFESRSLKGNDQGSGNTTHGHPPQPLQWLLINNTN